MDFENIRNRKTKILQELKLPGLDAPLRQGTLIFATGSAASATRI
jgi:hypothetical protein